MAHPFRHTIAASDALRLRGWARGLPWLLMGVVLAGCWGRGTPPPPDSATETPTPEAKSTSPAPSPSPDTITIPDPPATQSADAVMQLPDSLVKTWEPASQVLYEFGQLTITPDQVQWAQGQSSPYTVVSTADGYLLQLESAPSFYDTPHPYIKLMPQRDDQGTITDVEVAFYETETAAEKDEYIMFGSYF